MTFRDIHFPETFQYSSDSENIPLEFYESTFPIANEIDLLLGYFSSNAFKVLSESFAEFILQINQNEPTKEFAESYYAQLDGFVKKAKEIRMQPVSM